MPPTPLFHQPCGVGIKDRQITNRIFLPVRKGNLRLRSTDIAQDTIDKACYATGINRFGLLDCFVDRCRFRDPIHIKYLVEGKAKDVQDGEFYLSERKADSLLNYPIKPKPPPQNPLNQVNDKRPISFIQMGVFLKLIYQVSLLRAGPIFLPV